MWILSSIQVANVVLRFWSIHSFIVRGGEGGKDIYINKRKNLLIHYAKSVVV